MQLRSYQVEGIKRLCKGSCLLLDDVGMGKGVQACAALRLLQPRRVLIICPLSMVRTWQEELAVWCPDLEFQAHSTDWSCYRFITNYERLEPYMKRSWDLVVVDESHKCKNRKAQRSRNCYEIAKHSAVVWELTATPWMNRVDEVWHQLHLAFRKDFRSYWNFAMEWCNTGRSQWSASGIEILPGLKQGRDEAFAEMLSPYILKRIKEEVGPELPKVTTQVHWLDMTGPQAELHKAIMKQLKVEIEGGDPLTVRNVLARTMYARRCAVSPALLNAPGSGCKLTALNDLLDGVNRPTIVFSQWSSPLVLSYDGLNDDDRPAFLYTGALSETKRDSQITAWERCCRGRLLATMGAGGVGIDLTHSSDVYVLDEPWNPAELKQAIGRVDRFTQTKPVNVHILRSKGSIEEYVVDTLGRKEAMVEALNRAIRNA